jgi:hypothetical protein
VAGDRKAIPEQSKYSLGVGNLLYLMKWSHPEIMNSTRDLSQFMQQAAKAYMKVIYRVMRYCIETPTED